MVNTTLLVMAKDEILGMKEIMPRISREWVQQILVVDGQSSDGTAEWARDNGYEVYVQKEPGFRAAYTEVWPMIRGDYVITFSPDGNSIPEKIQELVKKLDEGDDMVIVSRYLNDAESQDDTMLSAFGNWLFTKTINLLNGGRYTDAMGIFRAYDIRLKDKLELDKAALYRMPEKVCGVTAKLSWEPLLSGRAARARLRVSEIEGSEPPRIDGKSRVFPSLWVQIKWGVAYYLQIIIDSTRSLDRLNKDT